MTERPQEQWYTNRDLFEMLQELKEELRETRTLIRQYNGLREVVNEVRDDVADMKAAKIERYNVGKTIRDWGGWLVAFLVLVERMGWLEWMK